MGDEESRYMCRNCWAQFREPVIVMERHGQDTPPYEELDACPQCGSIDFEETEEEDWN